MTSAHRLTPKADSKPLNRQFRTQHLIFAAEVLCGEDGFETFCAAAERGQKRGHVKGGSQKVNLKEKREGSDR